MLAPPGDLLRVGLSLKLNQIRRAARAYLQDRTDQATSALTGYAVAAGLLVVAASLAIAAFFVGATALFRWVEITHGMFWAFGAVGGSLLLLAALCAAFALVSLRRPRRRVPTLATRLAAAVTANPLRSEDATRDPASGIPVTPSPPLSPETRRRRAARGRGTLAVPVIAAATLVGLLMMRRRPPRIDR